MVAAVPNLGRTEAALAGGAAKGVSRLSRCTGSGKHESFRMTREQDEALKTTLEGPHSWQNP